MKDIFGAPLLRRNGLYEISWRGNRGSHFKEPLVLGIAEVKVRKERVYRGGFRKKPRVILDWLCKSSGFVDRLRVISHPLEPEELEFKPISREDLVLYIHMNLTPLFDSYLKGEK